MYLFHTERLETYFPRNLLLREFITIINKVQELEPTPSFRVEYLGDLFRKYEQLTQNKVSSSLKAIVDKEEKDLNYGHIKQLVNKVIFNEFTTRELDYSRSEFHEHTFDIHLTYKNGEVCIFNLIQVEDDKLDDYDPNEANDTRFVKNTNKDYFSQLYLQAGNGLIIAPKTTHFLGFYPENQSEGSLITKAVVKIDERYAHLFGLY